MSPSLFGIENITNITTENLTSIGNITEPVDFLVNINTTVYAGWLYFVLLWTLWIILYLAMQSRIDQPLNAGMYGGFVVSLLALFMRAIGLMTDFQMWMFIIITIVLASIIYATRDK